MRVLRDSFSGAYGEIPWPSNDTNLYALYAVHSNGNRQSTNLNTSMSNYDFITFTANGVQDVPNILSNKSKHGLSNQLKKCANIFKGLSGLFKVDFKNFTNLFKDKSEVLKELSDLHVCKLMSHRLTD